MDENINDQRQSMRKDLPVVIDATNAITGEIMGQIANISVEGLMMITTQAVAEGSISQMSFSISLPGDAMFDFSIGSGGAVVRRSQSFQQLLGGLSNRGYFRS